MNINTLTELDEAIETLEHKKLHNKQALTVQFTETVDTYKPKNLLKAAIKNATEDGSTAAVLLKAAGGIGAGILGGKFLAGGSILSKIAGVAIKTGAVEGVINNKDKILAWGKAIYNNVLKKK